jgi:hypothetical protein
MSPTLRRWLVPSIFRCLGYLAFAILLAQLGCSAGERAARGGFPDRSFETLYRLDKEAIRPGLTQQDVVDLLGPPDRKDFIGKVTNLVYGVKPGPGWYLISVQDGRVGGTAFEWGY